jgi:hypothetical protein
MPCGLLGKVLAAAEADFEPDRRDRGGKKRRRVKPTPLRQRNRQPWQQRFGELALAGAQRPAAPAPI